MERSHAVREGGMYNSDVEFGEPTPIRSRSGLIARLLQMLARMEEISSADRLLREAGVNWGCSHRSLSLLP